MKAPKNLTIEYEPYPHLRDDEGCVLAADYVNTGKVDFILEALKLAVEHNNKTVTEKNAEIERLTSVLQKIASLELVGGAAANAAQAALSSHEVSTNKSGPYRGIKDNAGDGKEPPSQHAAPLTSHANKKGG